MRRVFIIVLAVTASCGPVARATDLNLTVEAEGCEASTITVGPACEITYRVIAELSDTANAGLALIVFDLQFDGGDLSQADEPSELPMLNFVPPAGFSGNPDGYGGTPRGGKLVQVGGAQNVFKHGQWACENDDDCPGASTCDGVFCTPVPGLPVGMLMMGVGHPGTPVVVVTGTMIVPADEGAYTLQVTNLFASVIEQDATGDPFWATEPAGAGMVTNLSITVQEGATCCEILEACCLPDLGCAMAEVPDCVEVLSGTPQGPDSTCEGDADGDGVDGTCGDECPNDSNKTSAGVCGCGVSDTDSDDDTIADCIDQCPGEDDRVDLNENGIPDCVEAKPIPIVSSWGLAIVILLLLAGAKACFGRGSRARFAGL